MLGVADRGQVFDLLENVLRGDAAAALAQLDRLYQEGADPLLVLQDLLDLGHFLTRLKLAPEAGIGDPIAEGDRERARPLAEKLTMPVLARLWQMLLKGLDEVQTAPSPIQAAEMVLVRLAYVADLPAPAELVRLLQDGAAGAEPAGCAAAARRGAVRLQLAARPAAGGALQAQADLREPAATAREIRRAGAAGSGRERDRCRRALPRFWRCSNERREAVMRSHLVSHFHLVRFEPGRIEFRPADGAPRDLANRLGQLLSEWTGTRWLVAISDEEGEPTLRQQEETRERDLRNEVASHPLVQAVLSTFPGATIAAVRERFVRFGGRARRDAGAAGRRTGRGQPRRGRVMKNIGQLMKQAQAMQEKMAEMQAELEAVEMTGVAGGGMVELTLNGKSDVKKVKIDKSLLDPAEVRGAGRPDRRRVCRCPAQGCRSRRTGNAKADRRAAAAGGHEAAVLTFAAGPSPTADVRTRHPDPTAGQASGARASLGAARGAAPDKAAREPAGAARFGTGQSGRGGSPLPGLRQSRHGRALCDLPRPPA